MRIIAPDSDQDCSDVSNRSIWIAGF